MPGLARRFSSVRPPEGVGGLGAFPSRGGTGLTVLRGASGVPVGRSFGDPRINRRFSGFPAKIAGLRFPRWIQFGTKRRGTQEFFSRHFTRVFPAQKRLFSETLMTLEVPLYGGMTRDSNLFHK